jgi:uncharacterized membrane protein YuzA (DUF378 family)
MKNVLPQSFNDLLCLLLIVLIAALWILMGLKLLDLSAEVTGALIVTWTLLIQYYFRKKNSAP